MNELSCVIDLFAFTHNITNSKNEVIAQVTLKDLPQQMVQYSIQTNTPIIHLFGNKAYLEPIANDIMKYNQTYGITNLEVRIN